MKKLDEIISIFKKRNLLKKYRLNNAGIFGSILYTDQANDIDILISDFSDYKDLIGLKTELEEATEKSADIVISKYASPIILRRAKKDIRYVT